MTIPRLARWSPKGYVTVHYLETRESSSKPLPHKRKTVEIIATLRSGMPMTAAELESACEVSEANVMSTLKLLREHGLVRFAGWGKRAANGGHHPATVGMSRELRSTADARRRAPLRAPTDLPRDGARDIVAALNGILADVFALYLKTKNFHWHVSGPHFRDYHLLLDEQATELFAMTDAVAERVRKVGGTTLRSIGHVARLQRVSDNDADYVEPSDMLAELHEDSVGLVGRLREVHATCDEHGDVATASLVEVWIDEAERRAWFLFETGRRPDSGGR